MSLLRVVLLTVVLMFTSICGANVIWSNPAGSAGLFDWSNGSGTGGLYADPTLIGGDTLTFFPSQFRAESVNASPDSISDGIEFELSAHTGYSFRDISITLQGDYGLLGPGLLDISGILQIQNLDTLEVISGTLASDPVMPIDSGMGSWMGTIYAETGGIDWTNIKVMFNSTLYASSFPGSVAFIEEKVLGSAIEMQIVPEPATLAFLGLGMLLLTRKSRKKIAC
ncbi:MAG: PEP-CTERM sorting domain-containing protein [Anaerohalosphaeraceae bacterium]|nr:PEP-CTERM sorting domain-containing protein [Anaerohalosphaeraceae bacterium]